MSVVHVLGYWSGVNSHNLLVFYVREGKEQFVRIPCYKINVREYRSGEGAMKNGQSRETGNIGYTR